MGEGCVMSGRAVSPEIAGSCNICTLYLETCQPVIINKGYLAGSECDQYYCESCSYAYNCPYVL